MTDYNDVLNRIKNIYSNATPENQQILKKILEEIYENGDSKTYQDIWLQDYKEIPVDKKTFITSERFLGPSNNNGKAVYPAWMDMMLELERTGNQYYEIVFTGATRTGKTSTAVSDAAYQLYNIMCLRDPQAYFSLKSITNISVFFFNLTATLAKGVAFKEFNTLLSVSPWFLEHGRMSQSEKNPIYLPEGGLITIEYGSDSSQALGKATICVVFDEVNFSQSGIRDINKAKQRMKEKYDTLVARVTGTFVKNGEVFGRLYVISSKNSDNDFMTDYITQQTHAGNKHMYVFDKPQWEVWPKSKYSSDKTFNVALGGTKLKSFVVPDETTQEGLDELVSQGYRIMKVPEDNKTRFKADLDIALRDIAGVSVSGTMQFITRYQIDEVIGERQNPFHNEIVSIGVKDNLTIEEFFHMENIDARIKHQPMFLHLDLSLNADRTGISGVAVTGRKDIEVGDSTMCVPTFTHIFSVALEAPRDDKIPYLKIASFISWLRSKGFNIAKITRDQFQSEYMAQNLEAQGFETEKISLDRTPDGYNALKSVIDEHRIDMLQHELLIDELVHLQRDPTTQKLDHPTTGCFTGDTLIQLVDGRSVTINQLMIEQTYRTNYVYTVNETEHIIEPKPIKKVFQTKITSDLIRVTLDNGQVITCTPEHRFMLRDGIYEEIQNLHPGDSLMPLYTKISSKELVGYRLVFDPFQDSWHYEHRWFASRESIPRGFVVHHCNYNKLDNSPTNLQIVTISKHRMIHNNSTLDYSKVSEGVKRYFKSIKGTDIEKARNTKIREIILSKQSETVSQKRKCRQDRIDAIESMFGVKYAELSYSEKVSLGVKFSRIQDKSISERIVSAVKENHKLGKYENATQAISNRVWYTDGINNVYIKKDEEPPEGFYRGRVLSESSKLKMRKSRESRTEELKEELRKKQSIRSSNCIWITDGYVDKFYPKDKEIPEGFYLGRSNHRHRKNHKIVKIERIKEPCRVYDLEIVDNHNFALSAGVFVHNSKDVADSFAGAVWAAILDNPGIRVETKSAIKIAKGVNSGSAAPRESKSRFRGFNPNGQPSGKPRPPQGGSMFIDRSFRR